MKRCIAFACLLVWGLAAGAVAQEAEVPDIGSRLELFVDHYLIDSMDGTALKLHAPQPAEAVLRFDKPWEGRFCGYVTVIKHDLLYYLYYRGRPNAGPDGTNDETTCVAVSVDGVSWERPDLGIYEVHGTLKNNVILANQAPFSHNFAPFYDTKPGVPREERFKAVSGTSKTGLVAWVSADGFNWKKLREEPIITEGAFDSQNLIFWSESEGCYCCFLRIFSNGVRSISKCTSPDFLTWTEPVEMSYGDTPREHLYTNQTGAYFRAPHIYVATAARFMPGRRVISKEAMASMGGDAGYSGDCSDAVLLTSRGGLAYDRTFMEGFVRPGIGFENWTSRTNYPAYGLVPVGETEMAMYIQRNYGQDTAHLQRLKLRLDGFASVNAPYAGGKMTTKLFTFTGKELAINFSTSAAGSVWVEMLDLSGTPIAGFTREDADEIIGDEIERVATWNGNADVSSLAGTPVRLRFEMKDADVYSLRFQ
jgi:hypothetical protein